VLIVLLLTIGLSYAYFSANITGGEESTTISVGGGKLSIVYNGGTNINANNIFPSNEPFATKVFTVTGTNTTDVDMEYNLSLIVVDNTFTDDAIHYKLIGTNTDSNGEIVSDINQTSLKTGPSNILLGSGRFIGNTNGNKVHTYNLELYFPDTGVNQNEDMNKIFGAYIETKEGFIYPGFDSDKGVNKPVLVAGMTPVIWDGNEFIETTADDSSWYDYDTKQWANARTNDGSYWVWIPRYAYKITSGYHSNVTGEIDVKFLIGRTNETVDATTVESEGYEAHIKDTSNHYFLHPAFVFNDEELGFWVAKYASSVADQNDACYTSESTDNCNKDTITPKYIPNATSFRYINISNMFAISENMKNQTDVYGWNADEVDTHMMKNSEWGAVAYLSKSKYGAHTEEVWINSFDGYRTGCSGTSVSASSSSTCVEYHTENGVKASTTHNIYGVYDMSGGARERTSAYVDNGHANLTANGINVINSGSKYKTIYSMGATDTKPNNYEANKNVYGDGVYETSSTGENSTSWFGDYSSMPYTSNPFFLRGGNYNAGAAAGVLGFFNSGGGSGNSVSWRVSVVAKSS
jgi:hypothetical protein